VYPIEGKVFIDIIIEQTKAICSVKPNTEELSDDPLGQVS
jgi:hypothetical protein